MREARTSGRLLRVGVAMALSAFPAATRVAAQSAPATGLNVEGKATPFQVTNDRPALAWVRAGQYSYQIQVGNHNVLDWTNGSCTWFWDTGEIVSSSNSVQYPGTDAGSCSGQGVTVANQGLHRAPIRVHWRVRVKDAAAATWSAWTESFFELNRAPSAPQNMLVTTGSGGGINKIGTLTTGTQRHVGSGQTYTTIAAAVSVAACGDTVVIHAGTYVEPLALQGKNCTQNAPLRVLANGSDLVTLNYTGGDAITVGSTNASAWVSTEGLHVTGSGSRAGVYIGTSSKYVTLKNLYFEESFSSGGVSVIKTYGSNVVIDGCRIYTSSTATYAGIEVLSGDNVIVRGCDISGGMGRGYAFHGGGHQGGHLILDNYFHGFTGPWPVVLDHYYGAGHMRVERNIIVVPPNPTSGIRLQRDGMAVFQNNLVKTSGATIFDNYDSGGAYVVRNNIFLGSGSGTVFGSSAGASASEGPHAKNYKDAGAPTTGSWDIDYNVYYNAGTIVQSDVAASITRGPHECSAAACNPNLDSDGNGVYNEATDFDPTISSTALIDKGDPNLPVPVGGGTVVDIGRFELGATHATTTSPYTFQPEVAIASLTPRIGWSFREIDNDRSGTSVASQSGYRILVDNAPTFDSKGPRRPVIDSGVVTSPSALYDVPVGALVDGQTYYVTVQTADNAETASFGTWSDPHWAFRVDLAGGSTGSPAPSAPANLRRVDTKP